VWDPGDGRRPAIKAYTERRSENAKYPYVIQVLFRWNKQLMREYVEAHAATREKLADRVTETFKNMGDKLEEHLRIDLATRSQESPDQIPYELDEF
jgi:hypothetical protein